MAQGNPLPGERYLHFKNKMYQVVTVAYHSETMERYVVYQALYGDFRTYIRPFDMFVSEVDHEKYPRVEQKYRFQYVGDGASVPDSKKAAAPQQEAEKPESRGAALQQETPQPAGSHAASTPFERRTSADGGPDGQTEEIPEGVNPWLLRFLDAESFEEKYKIVCDLCRDVDDKLIDDIAVVMDVAIPDGKLNERYSQLKYCIRTRLRYEQNRLR